MRLLPNTIDEAIDLLAERKVYGEQRRLLTKRADGASWDPTGVSAYWDKNVNSQLGDLTGNAVGRGLLGAGIGAGLGGIKSMLTPERKRRTLSTMLTGGALGAGVGVGGSLIADTLFKDTDGLAKLKAGRNAELASNPVAATAGPKLGDTAKILNLDPGVVYNAAQAASRTGNVNEAMLDTANDLVRRKVPVGGFTLPPGIQEGSPQHAQALTAHLTKHIAPNIDDIVRSPAGGSLAQMGNAFSFNNPAGAATNIGNSWRELTSGHPQNSANQFLTGVGKADILGFKNIPGGRWATGQGGRNTGIGDEIAKKIYPTKITPALVTAIAKDRPGFGPTDLAMADEFGPDGMDRLFNRLTSTGATHTGPNGEQIPWTGNDRDEFNKLTSNYIGQGGGHDWHVPSTGDAANDVNSALVGYDLTSTTIRNLLNSKERGIRGYLQSQAFKDLNPAAFEEAQRQLGGAGGYKGILNNKGLTYPAKTPTGPVNSKLDLSEIMKRVKENPATKQPWNKRLLGMGWAGGLGRPLAYGVANAGMEFLLNRPNNYPTLEEYMLQHPDQVAEAKAQAGNR